MGHFASGNANHDRANFDSPARAPGACDHDEAADVIDLAQVSDAGRSGLSPEIFYRKSFYEQSAGERGAKRLANDAKRWLCRRRRPDPDRLGDVLELCRASGLIVGSTTLPRLPSQDEVQMNCALD